MPGETESKEKAEAKTSDNDDKKKPVEEDDPNVSKGDDDADKAHDPYYPPVITLPEVSKHHTAIVKDSRVLTSCLGSTNFNSRVGYGGQVV